MHITWRFHCSESTTKPETLQLKVILYFRMGKTRVAKASWLSQNWYRADFSKNTIEYSPFKNFPTKQVEIPLYYTKVYVF